MKSPRLIIGLCVLCISAFIGNDFAQTPPPLKTSAHMAAVLRTNAPYVPRTTVITVNAMPPGSWVLQTSDLINPKWRIAAQNSFTQTNPTGFSFFVASNSMLGSITLSNAPGAVGYEIYQTYTAYPYAVTHWTMMGTNQMTVFMQPGTNIFCGETIGSNGPPDATTGQPVNTFSLPTPATVLSLPPTTVSLITTNFITGTNNP